MLRVRSKSGKTIVVEEPLTYVEVLDGAGNVAMVLYGEESEVGKAVNIITPDLEEERDNYSKLYKVKWSGEIKGRWPKAEPVAVTNR